MRKFLIAVVGGLALLLTVIIPSSATEESFVAWDTGAGGAQTESTVSTVTASTVTLIQDGRESASLGTSAETANLGIDVEAGDEITVQYSLQDGATAAAGSTRLFIYYEPTADTFNTAPAAFTAAPSDQVEGDSGTLVLTAPSTGTIGTAGVVYDTSNSLDVGTVVFTGLTVAGEPVPFVATPPAEEEENGNGDENGDENGQEEENECIDLNTASQEELRELAQVDEVRAALIVDLRPIESLDDLKQISGFNGTGQNFDALLSGDPAPCPIESDEDDADDDDDDSDEEDSDEDAPGSTIRTPTVIDTGR